MRDRRKNILNFSERKTAILLRQNVEGYGCAVKEKLRIADTLEINSTNLSKEEYSYALKAHFDFIISQKTDTKALFAVEFDGPYHQNEETQRLDALKDSICEKLAMPLLRVDSDFIDQKVGRFQLLTYFIDIWFLSEAFYEQQFKGNIPEDEIFDPYTMFLKLEKGKIKREFDPAQEAREFLSSANRRDIIKFYPPIILDGTDRSKRYSVCLTMVFVNNGTLLSTGCFKNIESWPVLSSDIVEDIAIIGLANKIQKFNDSCIIPFKFNEIKEEFIRWEYSVKWKIYKDEKGFPNFLFEHKPNYKR